MQRFTFVLPEGFNPLDHLPGELAKRADRARWFVDMVLWKTANRKVDRYGYARLSCHVLRRVMGRRCDVPAVVRALVDGGVIEVAGHQAGVKPKGYRLSRRFLSRSHARVEATDRELIKRIHRELDRLKAEQMRRWRPIHHELNRIQNDLSVAPEMDLLLGELGDNTLLCQSVLVDRIRRGELNFSVCKTGRVFNGFTGIKRELRPAVRLAGEPLTGVDLSCAQPMLLSLLIHLSSRGGPPRYKEVLLDSLAVPWLLDSVTGGIEGRADRAVDSSFVLPARRPAYHRFVDADELLSGLAPSPGRDFPVFRDLVVNGGLYDDLVDRCRAANLRVTSKKYPVPRKFVKRRFLCDVLAKDGWYRSGVADVFAQAFPSVHAFTEWANRKNHATLIRTLQRLESWLVIEQVCPRLVDHIPIITLHDAIYGRAKDTGLIRDAFEATFDEIGFRLRLSDEGMTKAPSLPAVDPLVVPHVSPISP